MDSTILIDELIVETSTTSKPLNFSVYERHPFAQILVHD